MAKVGRITISAADLGEMIGLRPGDTVAGATLNPETGDVFIFVAGDSMPETPSVQTPRGVMQMPQEVQFVVATGEAETAAVQRLTAAYIVNGAATPSWSLPRAIVVPDEPVS